MKRILAALIMLCLSDTLFANTLQQAPEAEQQPLILDANLKNTYGGWLFTGGFKQVSFSAINPDYRISSGDTLLVQLWGGVDYQAEAVVDQQGNIFIPKVGPVKVLGITNNKLNESVLNSVKRVYKANVEAYVTLQSSQKVKVFLSGMVKNPGLYEGQSADSILRFIDQAGGIRQDLGSYRAIQLKRANQEIARIDLYKFLSSGEMPPVQMQDGDVIFVGPKLGDVSIEGDVGFTGKFELSASEQPLQDIIDAVVQSEKATHVTIVEPVGKEVEAKQYPIHELAGIMVKPGALIRVTSQLRANSISVQVIGEHASEFEMVVPWGSNLKQLLDQIKYTTLSNKNAVQLYRESVAERQKEMLQASLSALEQSVLTARSSTKETAELRKAEADVILQWIDRARKVQPKGQVVLSEGYDPATVILQQGDKVVIPAKRNLVMVHGEVLFPSAIVYQKNISVEEYIKKSGGSSTDIEDLNVLVMKPNGSFISANKELDEDDLITPGDEIFVLAKPDLKALQLTKDITQVIYQIAVSAAVVLAL